MAVTWVISAEGVDIVVGVIIIVGDGVMMVIWGSVNLKEAVGLVEGMS